MFGSKIYLYKRRQTVLSTFSTAYPTHTHTHTHTPPPEDLNLRRRTSSASRQLLYNHSDLPVRGRLERRGEGKRNNCHFLALSHPIPPAPYRSGPSLSRSSTQSRREQAAEGTWERCLYHVLILWLFLQFFNFKWENWNTNIDMKRFIVTIYHDFHRPYCYYSFRVPAFCLLVTGVSLWCGTKITVLATYKDICVYIGIFELKDAFYLVHSPLDTASMWREALQLDTKHISWNTPCRFAFVRLWSDKTKWHVGIYGLKIWFPHSLKKKKTVICHLITCRDWKCRSCYSGEAHGNR